MQKLGLRTAAGGLGALLLALLVVGVLSGCRAQPKRAAREAARPSNVVIISIDALRADRLHLYGYQRATSPWLDELSKDAVVFDRFYYSGGGTLPSHLSMLTSLNPLNHGVTPENSRALENERITLAEQLRAAGYATAGFTDGGWTAGKFGFSQGFDVYDDAGGGLAVTLPKAQAWIEAHQDGPFFLFLHTYDVHSNPKTKLPYSCPDGSHLRFVSSPPATFDGCRFGECGPRLLGTVNARIAKGEVQLGDIFTPAEVGFLSSLYDGCISYADQQLGGFAAFLKDRGLFDTTLFIVTADHGEEFGDHGMLLHHQGGYEEISHIPLVIKFPKSKWGGRRVENLAAMIDVMPTVLAVARIEPNPQVQGSSLIQEITQNQPVRQEITQYSVLKTEKWTYFRNEKRLFDLERDPHEKVNVYDGHPEVVKDLDARLMARVAQDRAARKRFEENRTEASSDVELSPAEVERLKSLGYLQ